MTPDENLRPIRRHSRIGESEFVSPSEHLRAISKLLACLFKKLSAMPETYKPPYFQNDEIDALFWLLAHHHLNSGQDVLQYMKRAAGHELIDFKRFDRMLKHVMAAKQNQEADTPSKATLPAISVQGQENATGTIFMQVK